MTSKSNKNQIAPVETNPRTDTKEDAAVDLSNDRPRAKYGTREIALTKTSTKPNNKEQEAKIDTFAKNKGKGGKPDKEKNEAKGESPRLLKQQQKSSLMI